jgi:hypothetical protein
MLKRVSMLLLVLLGVTAQWCIAVAAEKLPKSCCGTGALAGGRGGAVTSAHGDGR